MTYRNCMFETVVCNRCLEIKYNQNAVRQILNEHSLKRDNKTKVILITRRFDHKNLAHNADITAAEFMLSKRPLLRIPRKISL